MAKHQSPIIAISAIPQARLKALAAGADDVIDRDIDKAELAPRIRAIVRRSRGFSRSQLHACGVTFVVKYQHVVANGIRLHFTNKESASLKLLKLRRNMILTKEAILSQLYGGMDESEIKIVDVFICKIRSKPTKGGLPVVISTVWGRGYSVKNIGDEGSVIIPMRPQPAQAERLLA